MLPEQEREVWHYGMVTSAFFVLLSGLRAVGAVPAEATPGVPVLEERSVAAAMVRQKQVGGSADDDQQDHEASNQHTLGWPWSG